MFIGFYTLEDKEYFNIYYKCGAGYDMWYRDTFSPDCEDIKVLDFKIKGKTYSDKKASLEQLAKDWQNDFASLGWSYGELAEIGCYFYENAKRYGLLETFKENCIC